MPRLLFRADNLCCRYHWSLIIGPKVEKDGDGGWRFHAVNSPPIPAETSGWRYEEKYTSLYATQMLLVRVCVGKIKSKRDVERILRHVPIRDDVPGWNCVYWAKEALADLEGDDKAMGTSKLDWETVRNTLMAYIQEKKAKHRFDGQGSFDMSRPATYDLLTGKETVV